MNDPEPIDAKERVENLRTTFEDRRRILVLTHDNPDPDGLASTFALAAVLAHLTDVECEVGYAGIIGRAENRAMLRELDLAPTRIHGDTLERFDAIALVDTQPGFGNNSLPEDRHATADPPPLDLRKRTSRTPKSSDSPVVRRCRGCCLSSDHAAPQCAQFQDS